MFESGTVILAKCLTKLCTKEGFKRFVVFFRVETTGSDT